MRRIGSLLLVVLAAGLACAGKSPAGKTLLADVRHFEEGLRWRRYDDSASHVVPGNRTAFLDERDELDEDLNISEYEIVRISMHGESASVLIKYRWHKNSEGLLKTTTTEQDWEQRAGKWLLVAEYFKRGDQMPAIGDRPAQDHDGGVGNRVASGNDADS